MNNFDKTQNQSKTQHQTQTSNFSTKKTWEFESTAITWMDSFVYFFRDFIYSFFIIKNRDWRRLRRCYRRWKQSWAKGQRTPWKLVRWWQNPSSHPVNGKTNKTLTKAFVVQTDKKWSLNQSKRYLFNINIWEA
jgi:hypothetical protein